MGGPAMERAGFRMEFSIKSLSLMGFTEIFSGLPRIAGLLFQIKKRLRMYRPDAIVLIDSPDFNFFVARMARGLGIPVFYYISPQVWAWRKGRVKFLKKYTRRVLTILPFEKDFFAKHGLSVDYVGHPLLDLIPFEELEKISPDPVKIGILPGSREKEIGALMPEFVRAARLLHARRPELTFAVARAPGVSKESLSRFLPSDVPMKVEPPEDRYRLMRESAFLVAASGTVSLEAALLGTPVIVAYRLSGLTYLLGRIFVHVPFISLPNLILQEQVFPELLQGRASAEAVAEHALAWLENESEIVKVRRKLVALRRLMGEPGAPERAAQIILDLLR